MGSDFIVTLLGTGNPSPRLDRFGPSTLIEAADQKLVFDCGRGTMQRLYQIQQETQDFNKLFLTHLHSDHTTGIPDLWITRNIMDRSDKPLQIWGPKGTESMISHFRQAFKVDMKVRSEIEKNYGLGHQMGYEVEAFDVDEGFIYDVNGLTVEPFRVNHYGDYSDEPTLGYRIKYDGHCLVISGDTHYCENLIKYSKEADLLIHEVAAAAKGVNLSDNVRYVLSLHTSPEECGRIFSAVKPKLALLHHVIQCSGVSFAPLEEILERTRKSYNGDVVLGEDLMRIKIGDRVKILSLDS
jgi:ribonuclease Z